MNKLELDINNYSVYEWVHVDTCLPDYWSGHHLPHIAIPVFKRMSLKDIKEAINQELQFGYVMGSNNEAFLLSSAFVGADNDKLAELMFKKALAATNRMKPAIKHKKVFFEDVEDPESDCCDCVYAYFVLNRIQ